MSKKNGSGFELTYSFEYNGHKDERYFFEVPFDKFCEAIRHYFDEQLVTLDGTDNAIWNSIVGFGEDALDTIFYDQEEWLTKECQEMAFEEFKDYIEYYLEDDE